MVISHPDDVKTVFTGDPNVLHAGEGNQIRGRCSARAPCCCRRARPMAERKALLPPFHGERMQAYGELIRDIAEAEVATWPVNAPIATRPRMQALTLQIIMRAVFGTRDERLRALLAQCWTGWATRGG